MCVFIDYEKGIIKSTHEELLGEIKRNIQSEFEGESW